jgi:hypothetical protein
MTEKWRTEICSLASSKNSHHGAARNRKNFSVKHFSVIAFLKS